MKNIISQRVRGLILQAERALPGLVANTVPLRLVLVTPEEFSLKMKRLIEARDAHANSRGVLREKRRVLKGRFKKARRLGMTAREVLKDVFGNDHSELWISAGYDKSLAVPRSFPGLIRLMQGLKRYFEAHPEHEVGTIGAAQAEANSNELMAAIKAVDQQKSEVGKLMAARSLAAAAVRKNLQSVHAELRMKADHVGPVWEDFGLKRPGILQVPEVPENVTVTVLGPKTLLVRWNRPARGRSYRVWRKIVGVDQDFVLVGSRRERDLTMEDVPAGATIEIAVSACNNGGESLLSKVVAVVMS
jgi:hypothetical protein